MNQRKNSTRAYPADQYDYEDDLELEDESDIVTDVISDDKEEELEELLELASISLSRFKVTKDEILRYISEYGNVYISYIHKPSEGYLWRKLTRQEYKSIMESGAANKRTSYEEAILRKCMILPQVTQEFFSVSDAGLTPTLFTQIMHQTGFISDEQAILNIVEL